MKLKIMVWKPSGEYYASEYVSSNEDIPLHSERFPRFVWEHLPARISDGFVTVEDTGDSFLHILYRIKQLEMAAKIRGKAPSKNLTKGE